MSMNIIPEGKSSIEKPRQNPYIAPNPLKRSYSTSFSSPNSFASTNLIRAPGTSPVSNTSSSSNSDPSSERSASLARETKQLPSSPYQMTLAKSIGLSMEIFLSLKPTPSSSCSITPAPTTPSSRRKNSPLTLSANTTSPRLLPQAHIRTASESASEERQERAQTIIITAPQSSSLLRSSLFPTTLPPLGPHTPRGYQTLATQPQPPKSSPKRREETPELFEACQKKFYQVLKGRSPLQKFLNKRIPYLCKSEKDATDEPPIAYHHLIHPDLLDLDEITEAFLKPPSEDGIILKDALQTFSDLLKDIEPFLLTKVETRILLSHIKIVNSICIILEGCYQKCFSMEALYPYLTRAQEECTPALQMQAETSNQYKDHTAVTASQRLIWIGQCLLPRNGNQVQQVIGFLAQLRDVFDEITKKEYSLDYLPTHPYCSFCPCICQ